MSEKTWKINSLMVMNEPHPNTAVMSNFTVSGKEGELTGSVTYSLNLLPADPDAKGFTEYEAITEANAVEWTKAAAGVERIRAWEAEVDAQIAAQKVATPQSADLPWAPVEAAVPAEVVEAS